MLRSKRTHKALIFIVFLISFFLTFSCGSNKNSRKNDAKVPFEILEDQAFDLKIVDPQLVKELGIKFLEIENCLSNSQCYKSNFVFNDCGEIENYYPPMVATWWHYEYDESCQLISARGKGFVFYKYNYLENDSVQQDVFNIDGDTVEKFVSSVRYKQVHKKRERAFYTSDGILKSDTLGKLLFPCGNEFNGQHIVKYDYHNNGLLCSKQFFDSLNTLIVDERYYYSNKDTLIIDF